MTDNAKPETTATTEIGGVEYRESPGLLRISWDNRKVRKDNVKFWFLLCIWIVWAPVTCLVTAGIFLSDAWLFCVIWCFFGWTGTIGIPLTLLQRRSREWIEISRERISWGSSGLPGSREKSLALSQVAEFGLGWYSDRTEHESGVTLNIYEPPTKRGHMRRHIPASWLFKSDKEVLLRRVREFVQRETIPLKVVIYGPYEAKRGR